MQIKMIVTDMDGTFLNDQHGYNHRRFAEAFKLMQKRGVQFVIASGSSVPRLRREFADYQDQLTFISQNGAVIHRGQELVDYSPISKEDVHHLITDIRKSFPAEEISELIVASIDTAFVDSSMSPASIEDTKLFYERVKVLDHLEDVLTAFPDEHFTKLAVRFAESVSPTQFKRILDGQLPDHLLMEMSGFNTELIGQAAATKENAIRQLIAEEGIAPDEVVTFGDNENDLGMLAMTPQGYAMPNAAPLIKLSAPNVVAKDNNHDGVIEEIISLLK